MTFALMWSVLTHDAPEDGARLTSPYAFSPLPHAGLSKALLTTGECTTGEAGRQEARRGASQQTRLPQPRHEASTGAWDRIR